MKNYVIITKDGSSFIIKATGFNTWLDADNELLFEFYIIDENLCFRTTIFHGNFKDLNHIFLFYDYCDRGLDAFDYKDID